MGSFKVLNDEKLKDNVFLGFVRDEEYLELFVQGERLIIKRDEVEPVNVI